MLKIKDNIDLKVLEEKYGFVHSTHKTYYYELKDGRKDNSNKSYLVVNPYRDEMTINKKEIVINTVTKPSRYITDDLYNIDIIFDLIKDGLIEKVKDEQ